MEELASTKVEIFDLIETLNDLEYHGKKFRFDLIGSCHY